MTIPQHTLDHYNPLNNQTTALARRRDCAGSNDHLVGKTRRPNRIINLLIDTSLELVGAGSLDRTASRYALGAGRSHTALVARGAGPLCPAAAQTREKIATWRRWRWQIGASCAGATLDHAALLPGWRGTTPYYWLLACSLLIQSAEIVLRGDPSADYLVEKFGKGIEMLAMGTGEIVRYSNPHPAIRQFHEQLTTGQDGGHRHVSR
jgi:hypothetical protein